jgi:hypothetical protein
VDELEGLSSSNGHRACACGSNLPGIFQLLGDFKVESVI